MAVSLIELLVVLFIMGVMLSLLLPALSGARNRAQATVCQNNLSQLSIALRNYIDTTKRFPVANHWSVDVLRWTEEYALADEMRGDVDPNAEFPRPPLMRCPMQEDYPSRVAGVGFSHYLLVVDRVDQPNLGRNHPERISWMIQDRERLSDDEPQEPWFIAPELSYFGQQKLLATKPGPHPSGLYMTARGLVPK
jgi:type II secretory pathway pseudopilin PulG